MGSSSMRKRDREGVRLIAFRQEREEAYFKRNRRSPRGNVEPTERKERRDGKEKLKEMSGKGERERKRRTTSS